jgi:UDP-N-acetylglucosamine:LPS N-acetylglucosamine transferase
MIETPKAIPRPKPLLVAVAMGYGHLRPAHALGDYLATPVQEADRPPLADAAEGKLWARARGPYETGTRLSQLPILGLPLRAALAALTVIPPLNPPRDLSAPTLPLRFIERLAQRGLGDGLVTYLRASKQTLLTTYFVPALLADRAGGLDVRCVVTDSDINRVWAPLRSATTNILYYAPSTRVVRRLMAYGVPQARIKMTGFPLPHELLGGRDMHVAKANLARRLARLDRTGLFARQAAAELAPILGQPSAADGPPRITFAVGGAGAQAELADQFLPSLAPALRAGRLKLTLVAGIRPEVAARFELSLARAGLMAERNRSIEILVADNIADYFQRFNARLADSDALWTKPSEMTFFAALGLPVILAPAVGEHEKLNARWASEHGAALPQRDPRVALNWLDEWLDDGTLAGAAWNGFRALPRHGLYDIADDLARVPE